jgi:hypothetical protein
MDEMMVASLDLNTYTRSIERGRRQANKPLKPDSWRIAAALLY